MVSLQVFTSRMDQQVPHIILDEHARPVVQQIPTHEIKILLSGRLLDRKCKISTALGGAIIAQTLRLGNFVPFGDPPIDGLGRSQYRIDNH
jgi:hypothetical protein